MAMNEMKKNSELIFVPAPGIGHLVSSLEFAKLLVNTHANLSITVICIKFPGTLISDSYIKAALASEPHIQLIDLPEVQRPPEELLKSPEFFILTFMESLIPHVKSAIQTILSDKVVGLMLSLQNRRIEDIFDDSDLDHQLLIHGFSIPVPFNVLPDAFFNKHGGYVAYYKFAERFRDTKGIIVNTFSELEQYSIDALSNHDEKVPPIYAAGPLLGLKGISFVPSQIREIALGLKNSGFRFLWTVKSPPEEFLEWMELEGKGMICEWAPQVEILAHKAIGGFVSHCGWNSILESLWFGVPVLTWPIYAEQQLNAFRMVKELKLGVELRVDYRRGSDNVVAEEIEKGLKDLMDRDNIVHKKVEEIKEMARNAVANGGSSVISVGKFIDNVLGSNL
ncbi:unnamed protein product [Vicia faba]|uniref:Glycosyltransferase n=1 Tax=Vicia faba TaxID=3906 RepID=A0AAV0YIR9_VICFA|nr:unnamed protein product [Vicia faba]